MAKQTKRFTYQPRDPNLAKARASRRSGDFDSIYKEGVKIFKPREGKNTIRILPPTWANPEHYGYDIHVNYGIGVDEQAYLSLKAMKGERDPLDEARKEAEKEGNKKLADSLKPSHRIGIYLIDRMAEEEGVQFWAAPFGVDKSFLNIAVDEDSGAVTEIDNPDEGCDFRFYKEGTGMTTKYPADKMRVLKPSPLTEDEGLYNEWLEYAYSNPIPDMLNFYDYDHIAAAFEGHTPRNPDDPKPARGRKPSPLPDEDEAPKPAVKSRARVQVEDNEEIDEDTGEVTTKKPNGKPTVKKVEAADDDDNEAAEAKMSVQSIRDRLAGRRQRPTVDDED